MENEELVSLIQQGKNVTENMGILYQQNEIFIRNIVKKYDFVAETDDLMQEAFLGLVEAVEHYNAEGDANFLTYAQYIIKGQCLKYIEKNKGSIRIPSWMLAKIKEYKKLIAKNHGVVDAETIKAELKLTQKQFDFFIQTLMIESCFSLDAGISSEDDDNLTLGDSIADNANVEQLVIDAEMQKELSEIWNCVDALDDERKQTVILLRYKLNLTQKEVAENLNMSDSSIGYIENNCLKQLKKMKRIQELAEMYGFDCSLAYHGGLQSFKNHGNTSVVERIVMKREEIFKKMEVMQS